jgi:hypothetical protein
MDQDTTGFSLFLISYNSRVLQSARIDRFYAPDVKELGLGLCYMLEEAGGVLSFERVAEVLGDFLQIPAEVRGQPHTGHPSHTEWTYHLAWTSSDLRQKGFMTRNSASDRGMCALTEAGHELGRWAKRIYSGQNPDLPDWVRALLRPMKIRMKRLVRNQQSRKPPDYELCRWVKYCYLMNWPKLGISIFSLLLKDNVDEQIWRQAERQANVLKIHVQDANRKSGQQTRQHPVDPECIKLHFNRLKETLQVGSRIPGLNPDEEFEISDATPERLFFFSNRVRRGFSDWYLEWKMVATALILLFVTGEFVQPGKSCMLRFLTALLAQVPDAEPMRRRRGV